MKFIDLSGERLGRLTVTTFAGHDKNGLTMWNCVCDCGNKTTARTSDLRKGCTKSCGCLQKEKASITGKMFIGNAIQKRTIHGARNTRLYNIWSGMKQRCDYHHHIHYKYYGGKGICVCDEWKHNFLSFRDWALENGYKKNLTIDRIDSSKDYSPDNCQWITQSENSRKANRDKMIKKNDMTPEMLVHRQPVLEDTIELMSANEKFGLGLSISSKIQERYC